MFVPLFSPPLADLAELRAAPPPAVDRGLATDEAVLPDRRDWTPGRLTGLEIPPEVLADCRGRLVTLCRDCPKFRADVGKLVAAGPRQIAEWAGRLHAARFADLLRDLTQTAATCGMAPQALALTRVPVDAPPADTPLAGVVKTLSKRGKLRDACGFTLPLIVGRSLLEWAALVPDRA